MLTLAESPQGLADGRRDDAGMNGAVAVRADVSRAVERRRRVNHCKYFAMLVDVYFTGVLGVLHGHR